MGDVQEKIKGKMRGGKWLEILAVALLAVTVVAILLSAWGGESEEAADGSGYAERVEQRLAQVLSKIDGAGSVDVFVSVRSDGTVVIATESVVGEDGSVTTSPVLSGGEPIVLEECNPEITGVLIVADGADDLNVRFNLLEAAASVLDIDQSIIKVYTRGDGN
ncbi:MAG TPA: hypothetical protein H9737_06250 [Candidatus Borkfalkia faecigallinarum]|uniref:Stage III sporulation protein AG n=1 Tax=Candidatus Borkfalkia faecigallinarum TaxID=2838509 RepID=A0A9D1VUW1_9FIRM|nr:hypothetical protein [Candidatus Borkfalkia faecigallinarum]